MKSQVFPGFSFLGVGFIVGTWTENAECYDLVTRTVVTLMASAHEAHPVVHRKRREISSPPQSAIPIYLPGPKISSAKGIHQNICLPLKSTKSSKGLELSNSFHPVTNYNDFCFKKMSERASTIFPIR